MIEVGAIERARRPEIQAPRVDGLVALLLIHDAVIRRDQNGGHSDMVGEDAMLEINQPPPLDHAV